MRDRKLPVIFAHPVRDLTMARYLAAMEVDYFGIDLDDEDIQKTKTRIQQIRDWVEGPKLIGVSATPSKNIDELFSLDGYYLDIEMELPNDAIIFHSQNYFLNNKDSQADYIIIDNLQDCIDNQKCILKTSIYDKLNLHTNASGFMISPGGEEKIGLYDFEKLDDWFGEIKNEK
jgi:hypothetical protein